MSTNSQTPLPSKAPIVTSNGPLPLLIQVYCSLKSNHFIAWWIIALSSSKRNVRVSAKIKAFLGGFQWWKNNSLMSNMKNLWKRLFRIPLNQSIALSAFLYWFKLVTHKFLFAISKIALLIRPNTFYAGFIRLTVGLLLKFSLMSFRVFKLLFSQFISSRFSTALLFKVRFQSILIISLNYKNATLILS